MELTVGSGRSGFALRWALALAFLGAACTLGALTPCRAADADSSGKAGQAAAEVSAREILDHVDDLFRGTSSHGEFTMKVVTEHYTRELRLEAWSKGKDYSLIRILEPRKERGTATLKAGENIWNYLPKVDRVIKVPSSMMGGSWMGSHFTNDDLVKESRMAEDYEYEITFRGERDGRRVIEITLVPRENAAVVWGKLVALVREEDWIPLRLDFYDEDLALARTMTYEDVRELGGRRLPARLRVVPADEPGEYTEVVYESLEFDVELADDFFSLRNLRRGRR
jgi:outer membrane lipoprotein-sorting protein